ncbi:hypothetical protein ACROYT_G043376 [Oculina patagonica]
MKDHAVFASQIKKLTKGFTWWNRLLCRTSLCFTDQETQEEIFWVEPAPYQASSYNLLLYIAQDPFSACRQSQVQNNLFLAETILMKDQSLLHRSRNPGRDLLGGASPLSDQETQEEMYFRVEPAPYQASSYTHLLYKAQDPFSACRQSQVQNTFQREIILMKDQSLPHKSRNSGRDLLSGTSPLSGRFFTGWNQLVCRSVLTPISCTKAQDPFSACRQSQAQNTFQFEVLLKNDQSLLYSSRNSGRDLLGGTSSLVGQFLHPSPVQAQDPSARPAQHMQTVPGPKQVLK